MEAQPVEIYKERDEHGNTAGHGGGESLEWHARMELRDAQIDAKRRYYAHPDGSAEKAQARYDLWLVNLWLHEPTHPLRLG